jgi:hypothetical protein
MAFGFTGCLKKETYPETPEISLKSFETSQDSAVITLSFTDGDGDIGYPKADTSNRDFFIKYFERQNGKFVERILAIPFTYKIPELTKPSENKPLIGDITVFVTPYYYDPFSDYDTIRYEIYIRDRAMHESNHVSHEFVAPPH